MKLKITSSQFSSLLNLFHSLCGIDVLPPKSFEGKLLLAILSGIYKQLYKKAVDKKKKYTVTLSEQEALAFFIFFKKQHILPGDAVYEANLLDTICNQIHQKYIV